jgi:hypothetical protein
MDRHALCPDRRIIILSTCLCSGNLERLSYLLKIKIPIQSIHLCSRSIISIDGIVLYFDIVLI